MDMKLVDSVMNRLAKQIDITDKQIRENEEVVLVLNSMIEMGNQMKEKKALDESVEKRRNELFELEEKLEAMYRDEQERIVSIENKIKTENSKLAEVKDNISRQMKDAINKCGKEIDEHERKLKTVLDGFKAEEKMYKDKAANAKTEYDMMENKRVALKEEIANI